MDHKKKERKKSTDGSVNKGIGEKGGGAWQTHEGTTSQPTLPQMVLQSCAVSRARE